MPRSEGYWLTFLWWIIPFAYDIFVWVVCIIPAAGVVEFKNLWHPCNIAYIIVVGVVVHAIYFALTFLFYDWRNWKTKDYPLSKAIGNVVVKFIQLTFYVFLVIFAFITREDILDLSTCSGTYAMPIVYDINLMTLYSQVKSLQMLCVILTTANVILWLATLNTLMHIRSYTKKTTTTTPEETDRKYHVLLR